MNLELKKGDNGLELAAAAAFVHPNSQLRERLLHILREGLSISGNSERENSIRELLHSSHGTPAEPFVLSDAHCELAIFYAELCFRHLRSTRFRVTSEDAIRDGASVVITNNGKGYFLTLTQAAKRVKTMPSFCRGHAFWEGRPVKKPKASLKMTDEGVVLSCPWPVYDGRLMQLEAPQSRSRRNKDYSWVPGIKLVAAHEELPLKDIGTYQTALEWGIRTKSEAGEIRFLAACERGVSVVVDGICRDLIGAPSKTFSRLQVPLQYPETNLLLPGALYAAADCYRWINFRTGISIELSEEDQEALAAWFFPHPSWRGIGVQ